MLHFVLTLPPTPVQLVDERNVTITIGSQDPQMVNPDLAAEETQEFFGEHNDPVHAELVDVDQQGNQSTPRIFDGLLLDTIAPPQPGEMGIRVTRED